MISYIYNVICWLRIWFCRQSCPASLYESLIRWTDPFQGVRRHALPPENAHDELGLAHRVAVYVVAA